MKKIIVLCTVCLILIFPTQVVHGNEKMNCKDLEQIFGTKVESEKGVCKVGIPRNIPITYKGIKLSPETMELEFYSYI